MHAQQILYQLCHLSDPMKLNFFNFTFCNFCFPVANFFYYWVELFQFGYLYTSQGFQTHYLPGKSIGLIQISILCFLAIPIQSLQATVKM